MTLDCPRFWFVFRVMWVDFLLDLPLFVVATLKCRVGPGICNYVDEQWTRPHVMLFLAGARSVAPAINVRQPQTASHPLCGLSFAGSLKRSGSFFDCRAIFGEESLLLELKHYMGLLLEKAPEKFFVNLGHNALQYEPPLTFFRKIKTEEVEGEKQLNLKKTMRPIIDLARVYALKHHLAEPNTIRRIALLREKGVFSEKEVQELTHAFEYLMGLRLENQAHLMLNGRKKPKNFLQIQSLTKVQQVTLVEIFKVIEEFQARIRISFTRSL